jgi:hypothetical protein
MATAKKSAPAAKSEPVKKAAAPAKKAATAKAAAPAAKKAAAPKAAAPAAKKAATPAKAAAPAKKQLHLCTRCQARSKQTGGTSQEGCSESSCRTCKESNCACQEGRGTSQASRPKSGSACQESCCTQSCNGQKSCTGTQSSCPREEGCRTCSQTRRSTRQKGRSRACKESGPRQKSSCNTGSPNQAQPPCRLALPDQQQTLSNPLACNRRRMKKARYQSGLFSCACAQDSQCQINSNLFISVKRQKSFSCEMLSQHQTHHDSDRPCWQF